MSTHLAKVVPDRKDPDRNGQQTDGRVEDNAPVECLLGGVRCNWEESNDEKRGGTDDGEDVDDISPELAEEERRCIFSGSVYGNKISIVETAGNGNHVRGK